MLDVLDIIEVGVIATTCERLYRPWEDTKLGFFCLFQGRLNFFAKEGQIC